LLLVSERAGRGRDEGRFGGDHHVLTLRRFAPPVNLAQPDAAGMPVLSEASFTVLSMAKAA